MIEDFEAKYGIAVESAQPDASSQERSTPSTTSRAPTPHQTCWTSVRPSPSRTRTSTRRTMVAAWADIPDDLKDPDGLWVSDYTGFMSIGCDVGRVALPATVADLLKPEYAGMIALNGNPTQSGAGFNGVVMAALANGGSADDIAPGVDFFKQLNDAGNLLPVDPTPRRSRPARRPASSTGSTPTLPRRARWKAMIDWQVTIPSDAPPVASYYIQAINKEAPHPAAARLWQEYLFSPEGQNTWLKGFARPVLQDKLIADGTIDQEALANLAPVSGTPVQLTQEQIAAAQEYLAANWDIAIE